MKISKIILSIITIYSACFLSSSSFAELLYRPQILLSNIPPLVMKEDQENTGMLVDLSYAIIDELSGRHQINIHPSPKIVPWSRAYKLTKEQPNIIILQMGRVASREHSFNWFHPTTELSFAFVSDHEPAINSLEEARLLNSVAVYRASRLENFLREQGFSRNLIPTNNSIVSAKLLDGKRVESWYAATLEAEWSYKNGLLKDKPVVGHPISKIQLWAVSSKSSSQKLNAALTNTMKKLYNSLLIEELHKKYDLN